MKLFNLLKSVSGAVRLNAVNTSAVVVVVGGLAASGMFSAGEAVGERERLRSISSVRSEAPVSGLQTTDGGLLTSINVADGLGQIASAEDRARMGLSGNYVSNLDNVDAGISNLSVGAAAAGGATDGLGLGANATMIVENNPAGGGSGAGNVPPSFMNPAGAGGTAGGKTTVKSLGSASVARASGRTSFSGGGAGGGSGAGVGGGRSGGTGTGSGSEGYRFSGAMPAGSGLGGALAAGPGATTYSSGGQRFRTSTPTRGGGASGGDDIRRVAIASAKVAANKDRTAVSGAAPFINGEEGTGGGIQFADNPESEGTVSGDFDPHKRLPGIRNWKNKADADAEKRMAHRNRVTWLMISTVLSAMLLLPLALSFIQSTKVWKRVLGWVMCGIVAGLGGWLCHEAGTYAGKYSGGFLTTVACILGGAAIIAAGLTAFAKGGFQKFLESVGKKSTKAGGGLIVGTATDVVISEVTSSMNEQK